MLIKVKVNEKEKEKINLANENFSLFILCAFACL